MSEHFRFEGNQEGGSLEVRHSVLGKYLTENRKTFSHLLLKYLLTTETESTIGLLSKCISISPYPEASGNGGRKDGTVIQSCTILSLHYRFKMVTVLTAWDKKYTLILI